MRDHRDEGFGAAAGTRRPKCNVPLDAPTSAQRRAQIAVEHQRAYIEDRRQSERQHHAQVRHEWLVGTNEALGPYEPARHADRITPPPSTLLQQEMQAAGREAFMQLMGRREMPAPPPGPTTSSARLKDDPPRQPRLGQAQRPRHDRPALVAAPSPSARGKPSTQPLSSRLPPEPPQIQVADHDAEAPPGALSPAELDEMFGGRQPGPVISMTAVPAYDESRGGRRVGGVAASSPQKSHLVRGGTGSPGAAGRSGVLVRGTRRPQGMGSPARPGDAVLDIKMNESIESPTTRTEVGGGRMG